MKRGKIVSISAFIILFSFLFSCKDIIFDNPLDPDASKEVVKVIRVIETALSGRGDIAFDGEKFWKIGLSGELAAFDRESGAVIRSLYTTPGTGVAFLNNMIYLCYGERENILYAVDPLSGDIFNRISTRDIYPGYIASYNGKLIVYDVRSAGIFEYSPDIGDSKRLFEIPGLNIGGIDVYKNGLLISDMSTNSIYYFSMNGQVQKVFSSPASGIGGLSVDSSNYIYLFMLDGKVYKVSLP